MISNFKFKTSNLSKGVTLIEIVVAIFMVSILTIVFVANFPKVLRQFAVSRASYKLAQNLRRAEDLGLSGVKVSGIGSTPKGGYGIYIDSSPGQNQKYVLYADTGTFTDYEYVEGQDTIVENIDISSEEPGVVISKIENTGGGSLVSINFTPPNPTITITPGLQVGETGVDITLSSSVDNSIKRIVSVNTSGLIEVK